jgi:sucrose phosphorylase
VCHEDNISYFGSDSDEAQMVYNFALPPLVVYSFYNENARKLTEWAQSLNYISTTATYFNFLDSHDGIGLMAVENILTKEETDMMVLRVLEHGGFISYKSGGIGVEIPYEMNITWYSAINREDNDEPLRLKIQRYIASRSIALVLMGVPGIYFHGLLGSKNDAEAVLEEHDRRIINRKMINFENLVANILNPETSTQLIVTELANLLQIRSEQKAFHPNSPQKVLHVSDSVFTVVRSTSDSEEIIVTLTNVTSNNCKVEINKEEIGKDFTSGHDLIEKQEYQYPESKIQFELMPYQVVWLKASS